MGRYGVGSGALALRRDRRRQSNRRNSVIGDGITLFHDENYTFFRDKYARKNSTISSKSAPAPGDARQMFHEEPHVPGQVPPPPFLDEEGGLRVPPELASLKVPPEWGGIPGPSWWHSSPQGRRRLAAPPLGPDENANGGPPDLMSLFAGVGDPEAWEKIQQQLVPKLDLAAKSEKRVMFEDEVGSGHWRRRTHAQQGPDCHGLSPCPCTPASTSRYLALPHPLPPPHPPKKHQQQQQEWHRALALPAEGIIRITPAASYVQALDD